MSMRNRDEFVEAESCSKFLKELIVELNAGGIKDQFLDHMAHLPDPDAPDIREINPFDLASMFESLDPILYMSSSSSTQDRKNFILNVARPKFNLYIKERGEQVYHNMSCKVGCNLRAGVRHQDEDMPIIWQNLLNGLAVSTDPVKKTMAAWLTLFDALAILNAAHTGASEKHVQHVQLNVTMFSVIMANSSLATEMPDFTVAQFENLRHLNLRPLAVTGLWHGRAIMYWPIALGIELWLTRLGGGNFTPLVTMSSLFSFRATLGVTGFVCTERPTTCLSKQSLESGKIELHGIKGFKVNVSVQVYTLLAVLVSAVIVVLVYGMTHPEVMDAHKVDPTSLTSLIIVIEGLLLAAFVNIYKADWTWYDMFRGVYYTDNWREVKAFTDPVERLILLAKLTMGKLNPAPLNPENACYALPYAKGGIDMPDIYTIEEVKNVGNIVFQMQNGEYLIKTRAIWEHGNIAVLRAVRVAPKRHHTAVLNDGVLPWQDLTEYDSIIA
ncbi:hypothetical protein Unana1_08345 [Umbelopsis nana]